MTKIFQIASIILALFILCAPSCEDEQALTNREETIISNEKKEIREEFESGYLMEASLFAYETKAKQKLNDFYDYLKIVSDTSLNMSFRIKAGEMISHIFVTGIIQLGIEEQVEGQDYGVKMVIKKGLNNELRILNFTIDSVQMYEVLQRTGNMTYEGKLIFFQNYSLVENPEVIVKSVKRNADFYLMKEAKNFDSDTLIVWNVKLGKIK